MEKENILVAVHSNNDKNVFNYDLFENFSNGLIKGFNEIGIKCFSTRECHARDIYPNIAIAFDIWGLSIWQKYLNKNITNIMWGVDSLFYQNYDIVKQFSSYKNFVLFNACANDTEPIKQYIPELTQGYIPVGVDLDFWKKKDVKKEYDIVFFGAIDDYESQIQKLKEIMPELVFNLMMQFCEVAISHPVLSLWDIYLFFKKQLGLEFDVSQYVLMARSISYIITYKQRVKMIQSLKDFNVTVIGAGPWDKYAMGNIKVIQNCNFEDRVDIMNKAKIILHSQPFQQSGGISSKVLNASAIETMILTADNPTLKIEFGDVFGYCNPVTYEDIAEKASYYLAHEDERQQMAFNASQKVKEKHKWSDRAKSIASIIN